MKVITPRDSTVFMGPLGVGPILWDKIRKDTYMSFNPPVSRRGRLYDEDSGVLFAEVNPMSARYYKATDTVARGDCLVCTCGSPMCNFYWDRLSKARFP